MLTAKEALTLSCLGMVEQQMRREDLENLDGSTLTQNIRREIPSILREAAKEVKRACSYGNRHVALGYPVFVEMTDYNENPIHTEKLVEGYRDLIKRFEEFGYKVSFNTLPSQNGKSKHTLLLKW